MLPLSVQNTLENEIALLSERHAEELRLQQLEAEREMEAVRAAAAADEAAVLGAADADLRLQQEEERRLLERDLRAKFGDALTQASGGMTVCSVGFLDIPRKQPG